MTVHKYIVYKSQRIVYDHMMYAGSLCVMCFDLKYMMV